MITYKKRMSWLYFNHLWNIHYQSIIDQINSNVHRQQKNNYLVVHAYSGGVYGMNKNEHTHNMEKPNTARLKQYIIWCFCSLQSSEFKSKITLWGPGEYNCGKKGRGRGLEGLVREFSGTSKFCWSMLVTGMCSFWDKSFLHVSV